MALGGVLMGKAMLLPAILVSMILPDAIRSWGAIFIVGIAILFAANLRSAFLQPLFLIMMMTKFHAVIQNQPIRVDCDDALSRASDKFREISQKALAFASRPAPHVA